ncbi:hypothetical protein FSP39_014026 [Pinctada imbricata]|uniref:TBC1 domain family member 30 n=1 Tax=Pinctada imbricata TaxID=66713 RepID=A0AA88YDF1_PINIB|nr:hypothetical protein FSP39_014026 [Pinctada imbricata]
MAAPPIQIDGYSPYCRRHLEHQTSIVDDLLFEIYDRWHDGRHDSFESDTFTECSSTSEVSHWRRNSIYSDTTHSGRLNHSVLETQSLSQLRRMVSEMQHRINSMSSRLVRQLKRRDRRFAKLQHNCDLVTAIVQAASQKRRIDTRMKFSLEPPPGESAFDQWKDAMKAVARLPMGIPDSFRRKVWLSLADNHIKELRVDWNKTMRFAFNERSNPDDNNLGMQIVKDLHRTGCSGFSGQDNDEDRAVLKRVLLGYARWNKAVGYCQGFNVIAALLLEVMDRKEDDALKVMIYLIDHVLPESYYANNLRALSVDMAVFRDLLRVTFPKLSRHLDYLQHAAQDQNTGACYEPPLTNVFTMQWFLTMFATCLPKDIVLRVWDSILLEGSEILLRTALAIWGKLSRKIQSLSSADEFYSLMGILTQDMMDGKIFDADSLIKFIYNCAPFPMQQLPELREKYTYNIRPFTSAASGNKKSTLLGNMLPSDEDDLDEEDLEAITCFTGIMPGQVGSGKNRDGEGNGSMADISMVGPGAYGMGSDSNIAAHASALSERMSTDISSLKKQYHRLKQRQNQAHIIIAAASAKRQARVKAIVPKIETPLEETILHSEKDDGDSFKQSQMVEQEEILKQTRNIKSDSDIYCERAPEINPPLESQGTPLKSCLKSSRSIGNSGRSEGGNSRKMKLPKEKLITLTEYAKSKRKISSSSQESGSPKHFTDSDTGSVFSPDENNSSKSFTYTGQGERSVSFDSKMPSGLKPLTSKKPFNPFPVKHFNENRARTGIKLGIYKSSTFNELEKQSKRRPLWSK